MPRYPNIHDPHEVYRVERTGGDTPADGDKSAESKQSEADTVTMEKTAVSAARKNIGKDIAFYFSAAVIFTVAFVVLYNCFFRVTVYGFSMQPSYNTGDKVWVNNWRKPYYESVIYLENPRKGEPGQPDLIFKRVWGFQGDEFWLEGSDLLRKHSGETRIIQHGIISSKLVNLELDEGSPFFGNLSAHYIVSEGCIFVMGDNFDESTDSRNYGGVPLSSVKGVAYNPKPYPYNF